VNNDTDYQWSQFEKLIELHKFYFENLIKAASFSFGTIGAILTYVLGAKLSNNVVGPALQLPFILSIGSFLIFAFGAWKTLDLHNWICIFQAKLSIEWRPHAETLVFMSAAFALLFLVAAIGIGSLIINPSILN
jgi:hypothetical protein